MPRFVTVAAPAKVNLTLDVVGRREDGYHFLKTVMQSISLYDRVTLTPNASGCITMECNRPDIPTDEKGLCHRAAVAFFVYTGLPMEGLHIALCCAIPAEGGLGSGSADAAGVLVGLNQLYHAGLDNPALCSIGVKLGADVPFCIEGGTMLAEGIGEIFTPLPPMPDCWLVLAKPTKGAKTVECFAAYDKMGSDKVPHTQGLIAALEHESLEEIAGCLCNVLEEACRTPEVEQLKQLLLLQGALGASMTGSGTAVFGIFEEKTKAKKCAAALHGKADFVALVQPIAQGACRDE